MVLCCCTKPMRVLPLTRPASCAAVLQVKSSQVSGCAAVLQIKSSQVSGCAAVLQVKSSQVKSNQWLGVFVCGQLGDCQFPRAWPSGQAKPSQAKPSQAKPIQANTSLEEGKEGSGKVSQVRQMSSIVAVGTSSLEVRRHVLLGYILADLLGRGVRRRQQNDPILMMLRQEG